MIKRPSPRATDSVTEAMFRRNLRVEGYSRVGGMSVGNGIDVTVYADGRMIKWIATTREGTAVGSGFASDHRREADPYVETGEAAVASEMHGRGIYSGVLRALAETLNAPIVSDNSLTKAAIGAWKKSGAKLEYWLGDRRYVLRGSDMKTKRRSNPATPPSWTPVGKRYTRTLVQRASVLREVSGMQWVSPKGKFSMSDGLALEAAIKEFRIPNVSAVSVNARHEGYTLLGIEGNYSNGRARIYMLDTGSRLVPLMSELLA